jgi:hypothetical protein
MWRYILPEKITRRMNPLHMPAWPRWSTATPGTVEVSGFHLAPAGWRAAQSLGATVATFLMGYFMYSCYKSPTLIKTPLHFVLGLFGYHDTPGAYVLFWLVATLSLPLWISVLTRAFELVCRKHTTVRFSRDTVTILFFGWPVRFPRKTSETLTFFQTEHPGLSRSEQHMQTLQKKPHPVDLAKLKMYRDARLVVMQYGQNLVPVASFVNEQKANQFIAMCQRANAQSFDQPLQAFEVEFAGGRPEAFDDDVHD